LSTEPSSGPSRHQNLYAHNMWRQQRFYAGALVVVGVVATALLAYQGQLLGPSGAIWLLYVPSGLILGGAFLIYRRRSHVHISDDGVRISTMFSSVMIDYDSIRSVKALPLRTHFQEKRSRKIVPVIKPLIDKPALFIKIRGDETELAQISKKLGSRLMFEDTIAVPVPDPDKAAWDIASHLPDHIGQNLGGAKRRKRRR
jgi:hypothetical protein